MSESGKLGPRVYKAMADDGTFDLSLIPPDWPFVVYLLQPGRVEPWGSGEPCWVEQPGLSQPDDSLPDYPATMRGGAIDMSLAPPDWRQVQYTIGIRNGRPAFVPIATLRRR